MQQVLFRIPIPFDLWPTGIPVYGFGLMLFLAFVVSLWIVGRRAEREGISREVVFDLALPIFLGGIVGARIVFMIQYGVPWTQFFRFWEGGIVFYGSAVGGWIGYALARWLSAGRLRVSTWRLADAVAPAVCAGLAIGRIGCLLNGCCYGHVCPTGEGLGIRYPLLTAPARDLVVGRGWQTSAGFGLEESSSLLPDAPPVIGPIEPQSAAARAGLSRGDIIQRVNGQPVRNIDELRRAFFDWPRGLKTIHLSIRRAGQEIEIEFQPQTFPLYPTQVYESISMVLLLFVILTYYPFRRYYGQAFVVWMLGYSVHRFFNEALRDDTDPVLWRLTLSQVGSILLFLMAVLLNFALRWLSAPTQVQSPTNDQQAQRDATRIASPVRPG